MRVFGKGYFVYMLALAFILKMVHGINISTILEKYIKSILQVNLSKVPRDTNVNIRDVTYNLHRFVYMKHLATRKCFPKLSRKYTQTTLPPIIPCSYHWMTNSLRHLADCREFSMCETTRSRVCNVPETVWCVLPSIRLQYRVVQMTLHAAAQQKCIQVKNGQNGGQKVKVNHQVLNMDPLKLNRIKFSFNAHRLLGVNVTFMIFSLSDMCHVSFPYKPVYLGELGSNLRFTGSCDYRHGTEYIMITHYGSYTLYYCLKRPQWSIYLTNVAKFEYSICQKCSGLNSVIVFAYQMTAAKTLVTISDDFSKIVFGNLHKGLLCSWKNCRYIVYIRGFKYQSIVVRTKGEWAVIWNGIHTKRAKDKKYHSLMRINHFFTTLTIGSYYTIGWNTEAVNLISYILLDGKTQSISTDTSSIVSFSTSDNCSTTSRCRLSVVLTNDRAAYIQLNVSHMTFKGLKVPGCLFGGISFYEYSSYGMSIYGFSFIEKIESLTLCESNTEVQSSPFQQLNPTAYRSPEVFPPYTSSNSSLLLVFYVDTSVTMKVRLVWASIDCRGIFINPCAKHFKYFLSSLPYKETVLKGFKYSYDGRNNSCVSYQIGSKYLPHMSQNTDLVFLTNLIFIQGCTSTYNLDTDSSQACLGLVDFFHSEHIINSYPANNEKHLFGHILNIFHDIVDGGDKTSCNFSKPNIQLISTLGHVDQHLQDSLNDQTITSRYRVKVLLKHGPLVDSFEYMAGASRWYTADEFKAIVRPYSQAFTILTLRQQLCAGDDDLRDTPPATSLGENQLECLRDQIQDKGLYSGVLQLNFIGDFVMSNCSLGILQISSLRCRRKEDGRFRDNPEATKLYCGEKGNKENSLTWTLILTSNMVNYNSKTIMVDLPGSVYDSFISSVSRDCCLSKKCWVESRWRYDTINVNMLKFISSFKFPPLTRKSPDRKNVLPASWYDAQKMCAERGYYLPILNSHHSNSGILYRIRPLAYRLPIYSMFIGLHRKVGFNSSCGFPVPVKTSQKKWPPSAVPYISCFLPPP